MFPFPLQFSFCYLFILLNICILDGTLYKPGKELLCLLHYSISSWHYMMHLSLFNVYSIELVFVVSAFFTVSPFLVQTGLTQETLCWNGLFSLLISRIAGWKYLNVKPMIFCFVD